MKYLNAKFNSRMVYLSIKTQETFSLEKDFNKNNGNYRVNNCKIRVVSHKFQTFKKMVEQLSSFEGVFPFLIIYSQ